METFESITSVVSDAPVAAFTLGGSTYLYGPYSAPAAPASQTFQYEPLIERKEKSPVNSNGSWSDIKKSGTIVMSPYFNRSNRIQNFVVASRDRKWFAIKPSYYGYTPSPICYGSRDIMLITSWSEQGDFRYWTKNKGLNVIQLNAEPDVESDVSTTQSDVVAAFKGGYDVLTELAEGKKAVGGFKQVSSEAYDVFRKVLGQDGRILSEAALKGLNARSLLNSADKAMQAVGRRWLAYRYLIMPLVYSYMDISQLVKENGQLYKTFRSKKSHKIDAPQLPTGIPGVFVVERIYGSVETRSTVKAGYTAQGLSSLVSNQVQINPFSTAWELIPFSFVFDWFVNMGDFITSHTSADFSAQAQGCTSVRRQLTREVFLIDERDLTLRYDWYGTNPCAPNGIHFLNSARNMDVSPLVIETIDHYDRTLFSTGEVKLALHNGPMDLWKRSADAAALSHRKIKNLLRSVIK